MIATRLPFVFSLCSPEQHIQVGQCSNRYHPPEGKAILYHRSEVLAILSNHSCSEVNYHEATCYYPNQTTGCRNDNQCNLYYSSHRTEKRKDKTIVLPSSLCSNNNNPWHRWLSLQVPLLFPTSCSSHRTLSSPCLLCRLPTYHCSLLLSSLYPSNREETLLPGGTINPIF